MGHQPATKRKLYLQLFEDQPSGESRLILATAEPRIISRPNPKDFRSRNCTISSCPGRRQHREECLAMAEIFLPRGAEEVLLAFEQDRYMGRPTLANYLNICVRTVDSLPLKRYRINSKVLFKKSKVDAYIGTAGVKRPPLRRARRRLG